MEKLLHSFTLTIALLSTIAFGNISPSFDRNLMVNEVVSPFYSSGAKEYSPLLASLLLVPFDETVRYHIPKLKVLESLNRLEFQHFLILAASASVLSSYCDTDVARTVIQGFITTSTITVFLKFVVGRARPYVDSGPFTFSPFSFSKPFQSFPSGHASLSWAIFTPIAQNFGIQWYFIPVVFSAQRLWSDEHWLSDVIFGSILGWWIANHIHTEK